jgi:AraC family transcriptional regulator of adaptative response/methylated-DNA-[protein]-cysteine methyltransferase
MNLCDDSVLDSVLIAWNGKGVCAVFMDRDPEVLKSALQQRFPDAALNEANGTAPNHVDKVLSLIENPGKKVALHLDIKGTDFQKRVWKALREIPSGETVSYAGLAHKLDMPKGARAIAGACAANDLAVVIPCHRVVRSDGTLSGYRWGVERKRKLLAMERAE